MAEPEEILAGGESAGQRVDVFLARRLESFSRSRLKGLIEAGAVRVNGAAVKPGHRLTGDERITVRLPGPEDDRPRPEPVPLEMIYRDDSIVAINKPPGLLVHPVRRGQFSDG